ncbi:hypothetical protein F5Y09DRAFT_348290 [Xylaria sp. FL1042]|nr:hypothetical protein F5Y09DRAFT_348290 [Xylaria sp. FL1042]
MALVQWYQLPFSLVTSGDVLGAGIALPLVSLGIVAVRFYIRTMQKAAAGFDDWCILIGAVFITFIGAGFITGELMGYPTPLPSGANAAEAYNLRFSS